MWVFTNVGHYHCTIDHSTARGLDHCLNPYMSYSEHTHTPPALMLKIPPQLVQLTEDITIAMYITNFIPTCPYS